MRLVAMLLLSLSLPAQQPEVTETKPLSGGGQAELLFPFVRDELVAARVGFSAQAEPAKELCPTVLRYVKLATVLNYPEKGAKLFPTDQRGINWLHVEITKASTSLAQQLILRLRASHPANGTCVLDMTEDGVTIPMVTVDLTKSYQMFDYLEHLVVSHTVLSRIGLNEFQQVRKESIMQDSYNLRRECTQDLGIGEEAQQRRPVEDVVAGVKFTKAEPAWPKYSAGCIQLARALSVGISPEELGLNVKMVKLLREADIR